MDTDFAPILIVEDEPAIAELLRFTLRSAGWQTTCVSDVASARALLAHERLPAAVILDWMLPDQSGLSLLSWIRDNASLAPLPVIMLSAKALEEDKIKGFDRGADDYITKPFSPKEVAARVNAVVRRRLPEHAREQLAVGNLVLDMSNCVVRVDGHKVDIGHAEYRLLKFFLAHPERVFSRAQLLDKVWGHHVTIEERTVDVHILRLRKALKEAGSVVKTVRSMGYMLSAA